MLFEVHLRLPEQVSCIERLPKEPNCGRNDRYWPYCRAEENRFVIFFFLNIFFTFYARVPVDESSLYYTYNKVLEQVHVMSGHIIVLTSYRKVINTIDVRFLQHCSIIMHTMIHTSLWYSSLLLSLNPTKEMIGF